MPVGGNGPEKPAQPGAETPDQGVVQQGPGLDAHGQGVEQSQDQRVDEDGEEAQPHIGGGAVGALIEAPGHRVPRPQQQD